ncbi:putative Ser/Thr protein kinase [Streptomyces sp. B4I13]|uniref:serine/threonine-protein kinase n=1 Tax=Streptomyces sp. B4I13 TaxID=3042271 RepID=UPI002785F078|nr:serine/threonine-protein kinase [Streptomyces sp. B4I13]MDQ0960830.1 putative Ser/Thr protein kinase [Streptomyces sp. B4I13]
MDVLKAQDPARIGAHTLLARLGAGGMGQVYLGRSPGGRLVAIKVIRDEIVDHPEALARFRREVETVRAVRSAYTANLIDASLETAPYWLATEYVPGPTLAGAVRERGPLPSDSARRLFAALAEALASVHGYGVTHRDLKPQNVILSPQGPLLIDFGIARGAADTALTQTGLAPGTPGYTAPEVLISNQVGAATDVFALGATLAYAMTGRAPFGSGPTHAVSYRVVHEDIDVGGVEPELAELIKDCVAKDPARRPGPTEVITRCAVVSALAEDPFYVRLTSDIEVVPQDLPAARAAGLVPPGHGAPTPPVYAPTVGPGYVPTARPGYVPTLAPSAPTAVPGRRRSRRTSWVVALAVAVVVGTGTAVTLRMLEGDGAGETGGGSSSSASPTASTVPQKAPEYILNDRVSRDRWTLSTEPADAAHGIGKCAQIGAVNAPKELQYAVDDLDDPASPTVVRRARITFRFKYAEIDDKKPAPYYVSVGVKPPHEIDADTGKPYDVMTESKNVGYTSRPVDIYERWKEGGYVELTYPDDFRSHFSPSQSEAAIPVVNDPGDWTAVFYHVKNSPTDYETIGCTGFRVGSS